MDWEWSNNLAYVIGLITSDGNLSKDGRHIDFTSKDLEQVENFKKILNLSNKIGNKFRGKNDNNIYYRIQFGNVDFYKFLISIGLQPCKSKIIESILVPQVYFVDFLRGYFDGDGFTYSYWDKRWKSSFLLYLGFVSASLGFMEWMKTRIDCFYGIKGTIKSCGKAAFQLVYGKKGSIVLISKLYYHNKVICLKRKKLKIWKALRIIQKQAGMSKLVNEHA